MTDHDDVLDDPRDSDPWREFNGLCGCHRCGQTFAWCWEDEHKPLTEDTARVTP